MLLVLQFFLSIIPSFLLCFFVYKKDKMEKEPVKLLALLALIGFCAYFPFFHFQMWLDSVLQEQFATVDTATLTVHTTLKYDLLSSILATALIEQAIQWLVLVLMTKNRKEFNCLFDGVVYSVCVSFGFSLAVNACASWLTDWSYFGKRILTTLPVYLTLSIITGVFYSIWHSFYAAFEKEEEYLQKGMITQRKLKNPAWLLILSFVVPFAVYSLFCFASKRESGALQIVYYAIAIVLYIIFFIAVHKLSEKDNDNEHITQAILQKVHGTDFSTRLTEAKNSPLETSENKE